MIAALALPALLLAAGFTIPPTPNHYVTDNAGVLSDSTRTAVENELQAFEKATGNQVIVYVAQSTGGVPLETWTGETADHWKIGRRGHDDGAVLFLFIRDRRVRIEVGYGLESKLTDADAHRIIGDDVTPHMKAGDPDGAVTSAVADMLATIEPSYKLSSLPSPSPSSGETSPLAIGIFATVFVLFGLLIAFVIVMSVVANIRYGWLILREGQKRAKQDMGGMAWFLGSGSSGAGSSGGFSGGGGFSAGGGGFGGGGASGGW